MTNNTNQLVSVYSGLVGWYTASSRNYEGAAYLPDVLNAIDKASSWDEDVTVSAYGDEFDELEPVMAADLLYSLADHFDLDTNQYETPEELQNAIDDKIAFEECEQAYREAFKVQLLCERQVKEDSKRGLYIREHEEKRNEAETKVRQLAKSGYEHGFTGALICRARNEVREEME